jgi:Ni,Fe-hydrogenase I large subunit
MSITEGHINIEMRLDTDSKPIVNITSNRPTQACKIFIGKTPEQVLSVVPLLFNICGVAQSRASLSAIQQCLNITPRAQHEIARDMLLLVENSKEHLLKIELSWSKLFGLPITSKPLPYISQLTSRFEKTLFDNQAFQLDSSLNTNYLHVETLINELDDHLEATVFQHSPNSWCQDGNIETLLSWSEKQSTTAMSSIASIVKNDWLSQGVSSCSQLPKFNEQSLLARFNDDDVHHFIQSPQWEGNCYETTVLSRQLSHPIIKSLNNEFGTGLITRWTARLAELAMIPQQLRNLLQQLKRVPPSDTTMSTTTTELAQVEAVRGLLVHRVTIENGLINQYQILAPTEWNFHPEGLIKQCLENINSSKQVENIAHLVINSIDPCVGYNLSIQHA